jgi:hypothetical protein
VPSVDIYTTDNVAAARLGAACLGARSPWTNVLATEANFVLGQKLPIAAAGTPDARRAAFRHAKPMSVQLPLFAALSGTDLASVGLMSTALLSTEQHTTALRQPKNVQTTRIDAGGYGAMGPLPERERLA